MFLQPYALVHGATSPVGVRYFQQDELGNVLGLSDGTSISQSLSYDVWGTPTVSGSGQGSLYWKGLLWDGDVVQLYYMRNRWYDPELGRFVSEDPIGHSGGINLYVFAGNDPVNGSDPSGLGRCWVIKGAQWVEILPSGEVVVTAEQDRIICVDGGGGGGGDRGGSGTGWDWDCYGRAATAPQCAEPQREAEDVARQSTRSARQCFAENTAWLRGAAARSVAVAAASTGVALATVGRVAVAAGRADILRAAVDFDLFFNVPGSSASLIESAIARSSAGKALAGRGAAAARVGIRGLGLAGAAVTAYLGASYAICAINPDY